MTCKHRKFTNLTSRTNGKTLAKWCLNCGAIQDVFQDNRKRKKWTLPTAYKAERQAELVANKTKLFFNNLVDMIEKTDWTKTKEINMELI